MTSSLLSGVSDRLTSISDTPALDASVLLARIADKPRTWVLAHPELTITPGQQDRLNDALKRLEKGEPFPYVLGRWEFFGIEFDVTPDVLIPRPETELLVEKAIAWLQRSKHPMTVADIGTGCGTIAVSLAVHVHDITILATDLSPKALQVAEQNAVKHGVGDRIRFMECDLLPGSPKMAIDLLCANLPYIPTGILHELPIYGREPTLALDGGFDGLEPYRRLLKILPDWLAAKSMLLLEIEATCGIPALQLTRTLFPQANIRLHKDLTGRDRLLAIQL